MAKEVIKGNMATALAAKLCRPDVIPAYPITPSTLFPEKISEYMANGEMITRNGGPAEFMPVESEHSAMSACIGASAAGARTCTATASQGLALMHEMLFIAAGMRLPVVMPVGNRALAAPINIWCDHQDSISSRDAGWLQFYAEKNQEALDLTIMAFRVGEDSRVLLPVMVGLDAFVLTHTMETVDVPSQESVDDFLPEYNPVHCFLDPKEPMTIGSFGTPDVYMELRYTQQEAMRRAESVVDEVFADFERKYGRKYSKIIEFECDDADLVLVTMGSMSGTARDAVKRLRAEGKKVGLVKITVLRPFPFKELKAALKGKKIVSMIDRSFSPGFGGPVYGEMTTGFINETEKPLFLNFMIGLGGRDITEADFRTIVAESEKAAEGGEFESPFWVNIDKDAVKEE